MISKIIIHNSDSSAMHRWTAKLTVTLISVMLAVVALGMLVSAAEVIEKNVVGTSLLGSVNYDAGEPGTPPSATTVNTTVDEIPVAEVHTGFSLTRYASFNIKGASAAFTVYPNSKLRVSYKFVRSEGSTTNTADLAFLRPVMTATFTGLTGTKTLSANECLVENEWSTYTFDVGSFVTESTSMKMGQLRPFGIVSAYTNAEATEQGLVFNGTFGKSAWYHIDTDDSLYLESVSCVRNDCTVSFNANGGTGTFEDSISVGGLPITFPAENPVLTGFEFVGWAPSPKSQTTVPENYVPQTDVTLYAVYSESNLVTVSRSDGYTVVKSMNKAGDIPCGTVEKVNIDGKKAAKISTLATATSQLSADCWGLDSTIGETTSYHTSLVLITYKYIPTENTATDLDVLLTQKPQLRFTPPGSGFTGVDARETVIRDEWVTAVFDIGNFIPEDIEFSPSHFQLCLLGINSSGAPTDTSLAFGGKSIYVDPADILYIGEIELMYKYDYEVSFDANGGGGAPASEYIVDGFGVKYDGNMPKRMGYDFVGWGSTPESTAEQLVDVGFIPSDNMTLYAVWQANSSYIFDECAVAEPSIGSRSVITAESAIYDGETAVFSSNLPQYFYGCEFLYAPKSTKSVFVVTKGWVYVITPESGEESQASEFLESGFTLLGNLSDGTLSSDITGAFSVFGKFCNDTEAFEASASTIVFGDLCFKDDSMIAGNVIVKPAEKLDTHPEYAEYLNGARKFGGCPSITETPDGKLWMSITSGGLGEDMFNYAMLYCSTDGGENFGEPILVVDPDTPVRTSEPLTWCDPDGKLWFFWSQMYAAHSSVDGRMGIWCMSSADSGNTWTTPKRIAHGFCNQNPIVLSNGTWMLPVNIWNLGSGYPELSELRHPTVYTSVNKGETWTLKGKCEIHSASYFPENAVIQKADGSLLMIMRTNSAGIEETFSTDGGATWSAAVNAGISLTSGRTSLDKLPTGEIIIVSHDDTLANGGRTYLTIWLSEDDGETFPYKLLLDEVGWYPNTKVASDGTVYIVYDRNRGSGGCAMFASVTAADIKEGKLVTPTSRLKWLAQKGNNATVDKSALTFNTNGGSGISPMNFTVTPASNNTASPVPFAVRNLPIAEKQGCTFMGWATEMGGSVVYSAGTAYTPTAMSETLFAVFNTNKYDVSGTYVTVRNDGSFVNKQNLGRIVISSFGTQIATVNEPSDLQTSSVAFSTALAPGDYDYVIEKNGYVSKSGNFTVTDKEVNLGELILIPGDIKNEYSDFCGDGEVDIDDFVRLLRGFATSATAELKACVDINEDGYITIEDLASLKSSL